MAACMNTLPFELVEYIIARVGHGYLFIIANVCRQYMNVILTRKRPPAYFAQRNELRTQLGYICHIAAPKNDATRSTHIWLMTKNNKMIDSMLYDQTDLKWALKARGYSTPIQVYGPERHAELLACAFRLYGMNKNVCILSSNHVIICMFAL